MRYRAFISYTSVDAQWARWLIHRLETYRVPRRLVGTQGEHGPIGQDLGRFFRDREELTAAGDLGATIRAALDEAEALVVVCSPAAARSRWVNAEVEAFRDSGRGERVLCFLVGGDPASTDEATACFPPALRLPDAHGASIEPLAADARRHADGRENAFLKLVAALLGVRYDLLAQREAQRRHRRLVAVAAASLAGMAIALALAATAYVARNDAQRRQAQAEDILGFMLGDLRDKLTTVGRLDLMRSVDDKATGYFATLDPRDLSDGALEEQARSLTGIGQVRLAEGNHAEAMAAFREAHARSTALHERRPENGQRLFDLAQAEYWIGFVAWQQGRHDNAEVWLRRYRDSAIRLAAMDRDNFAWQREVAYGHHNLAVLDESRGRYAPAERTMREELVLYRSWAVLHPDDTELRFEAANVASWLGSLALRQGRLTEAQAFFSEEVETIQGNASTDPENVKWKTEKLEALVLLAETQALQQQLVAARANIDAAADLAISLTTKDPSNNGPRTALGICRWWQAQLDAALQPSKAEATAKEAASLLSTAHVVEPRNERVMTWLVRAYQLQAQLALMQGDLTVANAAIAQALGLIEPAWQLEQNERLRLWLAWSRLLQGDIARRQGDGAVATRAWTDARDLLQADHDQVPFVRLDPLVRALTALEQTDEAASLSRQLDASGYVPLQPWSVAHSVTPR